MLDLTLDGSREAIQNQEPFACSSWFPSESFRKKRFDHVTLAASKKRSILNIFQLNWTYLYAPVFSLINYHAIMLLVLSEEHKEHLGFLHEVDQSGTLINDFCLQLNNFFIPRHISPIMNDNLLHYMKRSR